MRKKEHKLKHKIKYCLVNYHDRYDRSFVKKMWGDAQFVPFGKTTRTEPFDEFDYWHCSQKRIKKYIKKWLFKRIDRSADEVYSEYVRLGWRNDFEKRTIWKKIVANAIQESSRYYWKYYNGLYIDSNNILRCKKKGLPE